MVPPHIVKQKYVISDRPNWILRILTLLERSGERFRSSSFIIIKHLFVMCKTNNGHGPHIIPIPGSQGHFQLMIGTCYCPWNLTMDIESEPRCQDDMSKK